MKDGRSKTSRRNLGESIPEALSPEGTTSIGVRLPKSLLARVDAAAEAAGMTRTEWLRAAAEAHLNE